MNRFAIVNNSAINLDRLLVLQHKPEVNEGVRYGPEHYWAMFDTHQELRLSTEEGALLLKCIQDAAESSDGTTKGTIATTSDHAM
jgi:hypothetical protein